jgi:hypothetical protein
MRLRRAGGEGGSVGYLRWLAHEHPPAFAGLVGKVLPMTIAGTEQDGKVGVKIVVERRVINPPDRCSEAAAHRGDLGKAGGGLTRARTHKSSLIGAADSMSAMPR